MNFWEYLSDHGDDFICMLLIVGGVIVAAIAAARG